MNKLAVINFSDIHLLEEVSRNPILNVIEKIADACSEVIRRNDQYLITISGDIAFSGKSTEYELFLDFFKNILELINIKTNKSPIHIGCVPGNHDCFLPREQLMVRKSLIAACIENSLDDAGLVEACVSAQKAYYDFYTALTSRESDLAEKIYRNDTVNFGDKIIAIHEINTSWLCERNDSQGNLFIPSRIIFNTNDKVDLSIAVMHHPLNWIDSSNHKHLESSIRSSSDFVITGHEHFSDSSIKLQNEFSFVHFESGSMQPHGEDQLCEFQIIEVDFSISKATQSIIKIDKKIDIIKRSGVILGSDRSRYKSNTRAKNEYLIYLSSDRFDNIIAPFSIDEVFVFPSFKHIMANAKAEFANHNDLIASLNENGKVVIYGDTLSGKTRLAKHIALDLINQGKIVVLTDYENLVYDSDDKFNKCIDNFFTKNYDNLSYMSLSNIDYQDRYIIIDDFHLMKLGTRKAKEFIERVTNLFSKIIIVSHDEMMDSSIVSRKYGFDIFKDFRKYEISEMGHLDRANLIESWHIKKYGSENYAQPMMNAKFFIDSVLLANPFPAFPIYILGLLNKISEKGEIEHESVKSYVFDSLVKLQLNTFSNKIVDFPTLVSILSVIAGDMIEEGNQQRTKSQISGSIKKYEDLIGLEVDRNRFIDECLDRDILKARDNLYEFSFKYTFYYSAAKYIEDSLENGRFADEILNLVDNIQEETNTNIVLFLLHNSRNKSVIRKLIEKADSILKDVNNKIDYSNIPSRDDLIQHIKLVYHESDPVENQKEFYKDQDRRDRLGAEYPDSQVDKDDKDKDLQGDDDLGVGKPQEKDSEEDLAAKEYSEISKVRPLTNIIGQVLKSEAGRLDRQLKKDALVAIFNLNIRWCNYFLSHLSEVMQIILDHVDKDKNIGDKERERLILGFYRIVQSMIAGSIKTATSASSSNKLDIIYDDIDKDASLEIKLMSFSSRLDVMNNFPRDNLNSLLGIRDIKRTQYYFLIAALVVLRAYMTGIEEKTKKEVFMQLGIEYRKNLPKI